MVPKTKENQKTKPQTRLTASFIEPDIEKFVNMDITEVDSKSRINPTSQASQL